MRFLSILFVLLLTACGQSSPAEPKTEETSSASEKILSAYNLYVEKAYAPEKYESFKPYLGAHIDSDANFEIAVENFEKQIGKTHAFYSFNLALDEEFPLNSILACYSKGKVPFLNITPPKNKENTFSTEVLQSFVQPFSKLNIPVFINFYENPQINGYDELEYINFFKQAKIYFQIYAPSAAFVWSIDSSSVYDTKKYYPGDSFVDWVGLNIYETINEDDIIKKVLTEFDYFYNEFQNKKPIGINLGISHFSTKTLNYVIDKKIAELNRFYGLVPKKYPRLKFINYLNHSSFPDFKNAQISDNFCINDNKKIMKAYSSLTEADIFTNELSISQKYAALSKRQEKLNFLAYKQGDNFFVENKNLADLIHKLNSEDFAKTAINPVNINNKSYYNLNEVCKNLGLNLEIGKDANSIKIF